MVTSSKRFLALCLALTMVFACMTFTASATTAQYFTFTPQTATATQKGEVVTLVVKLNDVKSLKGIQGTVNYDPTAFYLEERDLETDPDSGETDGRPDGLVPGTSFSTSVWAANFNNDLGYTNFLGARTSAYGATVTVQPTVFTMKLTVKDTAVSGKYDITFTNCKASLDGGVQEVMGTHQTATITLDLPTVAVDPVVTWPTVSTITYGQSFKDAISGGLADVAGSFSIEDEAVVPNASAIPYTKTITFTPIDTNAYNVLTHSVDITVNKAEQVPASIQTSKTYDSVTITPIVGAEYGLKLKSSSDVVTYGTNNVFSGLVPSTVYTAYIRMAATNNYNASPETYSDVTTDVHVVAPDVITAVSLNTPANLSQTYAATSAVSFNATTIPATNVDANTIEWYVNNIKQSTVGASFSYTPVNAGNYTVAVKVSDNVSATVDSKIIAVGKANPSVNWPTSFSVNYVAGLKLSDITLTSGFTWEAPDTVLSIPGSSYSLIYTPADLENYNTLTQLVNVIVNDGSKPYFMITSGAGVPGSVVTLTVKLSDVKNLKGIQGTVNYDPTAFYLEDKDIAVDPDSGETDGRPDGMVPAASFSSNVWASNFFNNLGYANFLGARTTAYGSTVTLQPIVMTLNFTVKSTVYNGNYNITFTEGKASIAGGTLVPMGTPEIGVIAVTGGSKPAPTVTWPTVKDISYGQTVANALNNDGVGDGIFTIADAVTVPDAGTHTKTITFTPSDTASYSTITKDVQITVLKINPTVNWPTPSAVSYTEGLKLSNITLDAGFAWVTPNTTLSVPGGDYPATFTPSDITNYNTLTQNITVFVNKGTQNAPVLNTSKTHNTITVSPVTGAEYGLKLKTSSDAVVYGSNNEFSGLTPSTNYTVYIRLAETSNYNASTATSADVTTEAYTADPITAVALSTPSNLSQTYNAMQEVAFTATATPSENVNLNTIEWYVNNVKQATTGASFNYTPTNAGSYVVSVKVSNNASATVDSKTITVAKITPSVTWTSYSVSYTAGMQLSAVPLAAGFAWVTPNTVLSVPGGKYQLTYTPADTTNYNNVTKTVDVVVNNAGAQFYTINSGTGKPGDVISLTVKMSDVKNLKGIQGTVNYDPTAFYLEERDLEVNGDGETDGRPDGMVPSTSFSTTVWASHFFNDLGSANFLGARTTAYTSTETAKPTVMTLKFTVKADAYNGDYRITFTECKGSMNGGAQIDMGAAEVGLISITNGRKPDPTVIWPTISPIAYGQTFANAVSGGEGDGVFTLEDAAVVPNAGNYTKTITFTPNDTVNYGVITKSIDITVNKIDPTVTWPTPAAVIYSGNLKLSDIALGAGFTWSAPTTVLNVPGGSYAAIFTPTDGINYNTLTKDIAVAVNKASQNAPAIAIASKNAVSVTVTSVTGAEYGIKVKGSSSAVVYGSSNVLSGLAPNTTYTVYIRLAATNNYNASLESTTDVTTDIQLDKITLVALNTPANLNQTYGAISAVSFTATTTPLTNVDLSTIEWYVNNVKQATTGATFSYTPLNAGNYVVSVKVSDNATAILDSKTIAVAQATPTYEIPTLSAVTYSSTAKLSDISLPTGWAWDAPTTVPTVDITAYSATYTPVVDTANYTTVTKAIPLTVNKATPTFEVPTLTAITYSATGKLSDVTLPTGWAWNAPNTVPTVNVSSYPATFTPNDTINYNTATASVSLTVNKATPAYTIPTLAAVTYNPTGKLADTLLPVGWAWVDGNTVPTVNVTEYAAIFTPEDVANYVTVNEDVPLTVNKAVPAYTVPTLADRVYNKNTKLSDPDIEGELAEGWTWDEPNTVPTVDVVSYPATFTPTDAVNYATVSVNVPQKITKANPTVDFSTVYKRTYKSNLKLSSIILSDGYTWDAPDTVLSVSSESYPATFTPNDTVNYNVISGEFKVIVSKESTSSGGSSGSSGGGITVTSPSPTPVVTTPPTQKPAPKDIAQEPWAANYIQDVINRGIMSGYSEEDGSVSFKPAATATRAEFATALFNYLGFEKSGSSTFGDTKNHWSNSYVAKLVEEGIMTGYNASEFGPDDQITREQIATILGRAFKVKAATSSFKYTDDSSISSWAAESVYAVREAGFMTGDADGSFRASDTATRAEIATIFSRLAQANVK